MAFIIKPAADAGLSNATLHEEGDLPLRVEGVAPGAYTVGRVNWAPEPVLVTAAVTVPDAPRNLSFHEVGPDRVTVAWEPPESDGGAPILSYQVAAKLAGSPTHLPWLGGASPQTFMDLQPETAYEFRVRARNSVGLGAWTAGWAKQETARMTGQGTPGNGPKVAGVEVGFLPSRDEGTEGDWFVSPEGDDGAAGTLGAPFRTIGKAMQAASGGDVIRLRAGTYRETIDFTGKGGSAGARTTVARYGTEEAIVSGFEVLTGWQLCESGDEAVVGPNYASIYKATIPTSALADSGAGGRAANLYERQTKLHLAALKVPFPFKPYSDLYVNDWLSADSIGKDGSGNIESYTLAGLSERFTEGQIENARIGYYIYPNQNAESAIAGFDDSTDTITLADVAYKQEGSSTRFCLLNLLPAMRPGQWGYVTEGATTTFYLWPLDAGNLAAGIFHSARVTAAKMPEGHCEIRGLILEGTASAGYGGSAPASIATTGEGTVVENCLSRNVFTATGVGTVLTCWGAGSVIRNYEVENAPGSKGIWGGSAGLVVDRCLIRRSGRESLRFYGGNDAMVTRNLCIDCGDGAHSNKGNVYFGGYNYLWWHNIWHGCAGYFTWQRASGIHLGFSWVPTAGDLRAVMDQNHTLGFSHATLNEQYETAYILNNITAPRPGVSGQSSIYVGRDYEPYALYALYNNVAVSITARAENLDGWGNNLYAGESKKDPSDTLISVGDVWEDISIGDIAIKADSPSRTATAADLSGILTTLQTTLGFDYDGFGVDLAGQPFAPDAAPVGPYLPGSAQIELPPVWLAQPVISGTPEPGGILSLGSGELVGFPYPARSYQWIRSDDDFVTREVIPGATSDQYEVIEDDIGYKLGCVVTAGGTASTTPIVNSAVVDSYPISAPEVLTSQLVPWTTKRVLQAETGNFTSDGSALLVVAGVRNYAGERDGYRVTVGTPARSPGSGEEAAEVNGYVHRHGVYGHAFFIPHPPSGEVTVQIEQTEGPARDHSAQVVVVKVAGAAAALFDGKTGQTSIGGLTSSITTQTDGGYVLWMLVRAGGSEVGAVSVDYGGSVLFDAGTSIDSRYGVWLSLFGEAAPQKGKKSAKTTFAKASASLGGLALSPQ